LLVLLAALVGLLVLLARLFTVLSMIFLRVNLFQFFCFLPDHLFPPTLLP
jgi:hypothetical protein